MNIPRVICCFQPCRIAAAGVKQCSPAGCGLSVVEWVTVGVRTREGSRRRRSLGSGRRHSRLAASTTSKGPHLAGRLQASPWASTRRFQRGRRDVRHGQGGTCARSTACLRPMPECIPTFWDIPQCLAFFVYKLRLYCVFASEQLSLVLADSQNMRVC